MRLSKRILHWREERKAIIGFKKDGLSTGGRQPKGKIKGIGGMNDMVRLYYKGRSRNASRMKYMRHEKPEKNLERALLSPNSHIDRRIHHEGEGPTKE